MASKAKIRMSEIERARKLLLDLPEKDDRKTREEAAEMLEKDFRKVLKRGYTPRELSMMLKNAGIIIPAYLVERFLKPENENPRPKPPPKPTPKPVPEKEAEKTVPAGQFVITPDTPDEEL